MKTRTIILSGLAPLVIIGLTLMSCDFTPTTAPSEENITVSQGIPTDQIQWVSWKQEVVDQIKSGKLMRGTASKMISADNGGTIGGANTYDNKVEIPPGALEENSRITVDVLCLDGNEQCGAGIDFLPSQVFLKDVKVTLSWEFIGYDGGDLNFWVYYSGDDGDTWFEVETPEIDYDKETVSVYVNHFTRFAWGF